MQSIRSVTRHPALIGAIVARARHQVREVTEPGASHGREVGAPKALACLDPVGA